MLMLCIISRPSKTSHGPHLARGPYVSRLCSIRISVYIILCYRGSLWYLCTFCVIHTFTKYPLLNFPKFSHMLVRSIKHKYIAFHWNSLFFSIIWHIMKIWSENRHSGLKPHWISLSRPTSLDLFTQVLFWVPRGSLRLVMIYLWSCLNLSWFLTCRSVWWRHAPLQSSDVFSVIHTLQIHVNNFM